MRQQHLNPEQRTNTNKLDRKPEDLHYEWSKGYLPTENPKADETDILDDRFK